MRITLQEPGVRTAMVGEGNSVRMGCCDGMVPEQG